MTSSGADPQPHQERRFFRWLLRLVCLSLLAIVYLLLNNRYLPEPYWSSIDIDSTLRLVFVKELAQTNAWFDQTLERVLPPQGLTTHWSRLVDLPIALQYAALSSLFGESAANQAILVIWPVELFAGFCFVTFLTAKTCFGEIGARFALMAIAVCIFYSFDTFKLTELDHHNLQLLIYALVLFRLLRNSPSLSDYAVAGGLCALAIAINPDGVFFTASIGLAILTTWAFRSPAGNGTRSFFFGMGFCLPVFFVLQTPPASLLQFQCDRLSIPLLSVALVALCVGIFLPIIEKGAGPGFRLGTAVGLAIVVFMLASPAWLPCAISPFDGLPDELRNGLETRHREVVNPLQRLELYPQSTIMIIGPIVLSTVLMAFWSVFRPILARHGQWHPDRPFLILLWLLFMSLSSSFVQFRAGMFGLSVLPLAIAFIASCAWHHVKQVSAPLALILTPVVFMFVSTPWIWGRSLFLRDSSGAEIVNVPRHSSGRSLCYTGHSFPPLDRLPKGSILSDVGGRVLLYTKHDVAAVTSHSNISAWMNTRALERDLGVFDRIRRSHKIDYVMVCRHKSYAYEHSLGAIIQSGRKVRWMSRQEDIGPFIIYVVDNGR